MKSALNIFIITALFFACSQEKDGVTISGTYTDPIEGLIKIELIKNNALTVIDSFYLEPSGKFERTVNIAEQGFYRLNFDERNVVNLILNDADIQIAKNPDKTGSPYIATGSKGLEYLNGLNEQSRLFGLEVQQLNEQFGQARGNGNMSEMEQLREQYMKMQMDHITKMKERIWQMDNSIAGILAISYFENVESEVSFLDSLVTKYEQQLPNSSYTIDLRMQVDQYKKLAVGSPAPEIVLPDPSGKIISLSSLQGNYVLIDFWAAWCRPCRMENPNVVRMYNIYHQKGFEILGVSLDRKKEAWVEAIAKDELTWQHVSDLQYFNSQAASDYQINAIPATYLIDPEGIIIGKNLRGPSLEEKLKEIFG